MYLNYFGLNEASFSITPDPQYLFLSEKHREALAHLLYGAGENGGFVMLTGEVGTGKTTICRAFLEQIPDQVDVALVLNPAMTAIELLHAICHEFGVAVPDREESVKVLVDRLNDFLLDAHARGRHPVLVIDEAQNLRPKVLEQVRLLTNLETPKHKLLQIFLIGQPELRAMLASPELRQLNQRITARFHLTPLSARETAAYVDHRIRIAGVERPLFSTAALREVHRASGGIPRLVNLICDRSLLGAAVSRRMQVTPTIVRRAGRELHGTQPPRESARRTHPLALAAALLLAIAAGAWLGRSGWLDTFDGQIRQARDLLAALSAPEQASPIGDDQVDALEGSLGAGPAPLATAEVQAEQSLEAEAPSVAQTLPPPEDGVPRIALARVIEDVEEVGAEGLDRMTVVETHAIPELLRRWGRDEASATDCADLVPLGLGCERAKGRWSDLRLFDRPAALEISVDGARRFAVVAGLDEEYALLQRGEDLRRVPIAILDERWSGDVLMLWQPPPADTKVIGPGSSPEAVQWLRGQLAALPDSTLADDASGNYDAALASAVRRFQQARGLAVDGLAGPRTLILLNNALAGLEIPRLSQSQTP